MALLTLPDGDQLHYEEHGSGEPLLLLAGLSGLGSFWNAVVPHLAPHFRVVLHDHRGTGRSSRALIDYSIGQMRDDVLALMGGLGIARARVVGHSTGGAIAQLLAIEQPDRVARLVLSATWTHCDPYIARLFGVRDRILRESGPAAYQQASPLFLYPPRWIRDHDDRLRRDEAAASGLDDTARDIMGRRIAAILRFDERARLAGIAAPTLAIAARDDMTIPSYFTEDLARSIPGAKATLLPEGGHFLPVVDPEAYAAALLDFLRKG